MTDPRYVRFPPGRGSLLLPVGSRAGFRSGIAMWSACRRGPRLLQSLGYLVAGITGPAPFRLLGTEGWDLPLPADTWDELKGQLEAWFGPAEAIALYHPPQAERAGFAGLLIRQRRTVGFFKCRPGWDFTGEAGVAAALQPATSFNVPSVAGVAEAEDWSVIGFSALPDGLHRPGASQPVERITGEISALLRMVLGEPPQSGWTPMHGDLGPWNLRHLPGQPDLVFDWERAAFGPPGADLVFYFAATRAVGIAPPILAGRDFSESVAYWREVIAARRSTGVDTELAVAMLAALDEVPA